MESPDFEVQWNLSIVITRDQVPLYSVLLSLTDDFVLDNFPVDSVDCLESSPVRMAVVSLSSHSCLSCSQDAWKLEVVHEDRTHTITHTQFTSI